jgi:hypothetical protein
LRVSRLPAVTYCVLLPSMTAFRSDESTVKLTLFEELFEAKEDMYLE